MTSVPRDWAVARRVDDDGRRSRWHDALVAACLAFLLVVAGAGTPTADAAAPPRPFPDEWFFDGAQRPPALKALEGKPPPPLAIESWIGESVTLADLRGKVVVVDFWATWCGPCIAAIPHNVDMVRRHAADGLVFVGVHDSNSGWDRAPQMVRDRGINYTVGKDRSGGVSAKAFAVQFWPTYVVIDRAGVVRGAGLSTDRVEAAVRVLLAEAAPDLSEFVEPEFPDEIYYGSAARPSALRQMEGRTVPELSAQAWGASGPIAPRGDLTVLTFVSPSLSVSMRELDRIEAIHREYAAQGIVFIGVCDAAAPWEAMTAHAAAKSLSMPIMHDARRVVAADGAAGVDQTETPEAAPTDGSPRAAVVEGVTAAALGVRLMPTTLVVDRTGRVRVAGVRADKVKDVLEKLLSETASGPSGDGDAVPGDAGPGAAGPGAGAGGGAP